MRGSIGNAVDAVGGIKEFLADQVPDADPDDKTPGQPKFASLQDMLVALDTASYRLRLDHRRPRRPTDARHATTRRRRRSSFTLRTTRGGVADLELNILGRRHDRDRHLHRHRPLRHGRRLNGPSDATGAELVGRKVTSGASYGTIATVPTATTLTLTADGWVGGQPAERLGVPVEAADPKTGAPEFADILEDHDRHRARPTPRSRPRRSRRTSCSPCRWRST